MTSSEWLLLMAAIGLVGVVYEFTAPGWILPGAVGGVLLSVGAYRLFTNTPVQLRAVTAMSVSIPAVLLAGLLIYIAVRGNANKADLQSVRTNDPPIAR